MNGIHALRPYPVPDVLMLSLYGALLSFTMAPWHATWLWFLVMPFVMQHAQRLSSSWKRAWGKGLAFGTSFFVFAHYWVAYAFLVNDSDVVWLMPLSLFGLPLFEAQGFGLLFLLLHWLRAGPLGSGIVWVLGWAAIEAWRSVLFPWTLASHSIDSLVLLHHTIWAGEVGGGLILILMTSLGYWLYHCHRLSYRAIIISLWAISAGLLWGSGLSLMDSYPAFFESDPVTVRLVQPNIPQHLKWNPERADAHMTRLVNLSHHAPDNTLVIWPESAIPQIVTRVTMASPLLKESIPTQGFLLSGAMMVDRFNRPTTLWNSMILFTPEGPIDSYYHKHRLVPFGEYIPGSRWLKPFSFSLMPMTPGEGPALIAPSGIPAFSPSVCFEIAFADAVHPEAKWIINVTNDGWYRNSPGPYQHLHMARIRAIQQKKPVIRVANTGISAIIDAHGRLVASLPYGREGIIDMTLPPRP